MKHARTAATSTIGLQSRRSACSGALGPAMNALAPIAKLSGCDLSARASSCPSNLVLTNNYNMVPKDWQALRFHKSPELSCLTR